MRLFDSLEQISLEVILNICSLSIIAYCYFNESTSSIRVNDDVWYCWVVHARTKANWHKILRVCADLRGNHIDALCIVSTNLHTTQVIPETTHKIDKKSLPFEGEYSNVVLNIHMRGRLLNIYVCVCECKNIKYYIEKMLVVN